MSKKNSYEPVDASPVKSFFVHMLTRDIRLEEAILDLIDNCVDGILRSQHATNTDRPYEGFRAEIDFKKDSFSISDNCGGIPWSVHDYAFRMGRRADQPPDTPGTARRDFSGAKLAVQYAPYMPFFLHRIENDEFVRERSNIPLAGLHGPLSWAARRSPENLEWELPETEVVRFFGVDPENHAVVIDLKPRVSTEVSLYRLKHIWGYSSNGWTPLALELEALYVDDAPPAGIASSVFRDRFSVPSQPGERIYEFLYVNGDGKSGRWTFGRVGSVNAALLWEHVFDSFLKRINRTRRDQGRPAIGA